MLAGNEPGSTTGNLTSANFRYFMPGGQMKVLEVLLRPLA